MNINLHIERLVLDGLPLERRDGAALQAALETALADLLAARGLPQTLQSGGAVPWLSGGPQPTVSSGDPASAGTQIAHAVYDSLNQIRT